jgi:hypothetical protein
MTTNTKTAVRPHAVLKLPKVVSQLVTFVQNVVTRMTGNPSFPSPSPALATVSTAATELQSAETAALARTKGAVALRNERREALVALLEQLRAYVQAIADANPDNGTSIIEGSGLPLRKSTSHGPRQFSARPGPVSGSAKLYAASAGPRSAYLWQYSADGGKTWVDWPATLQAKTTVTGLTPGATVEFRVQPVRKTGEGDWSQTVSLIIK